MRRLRDHRRWGVLLILPMLLLVGCSGGGGTTATPKLAGNTPGAGTPLTTALPGATRTIDKVDQVFLQLLAVYQTQGLDGAKQFARAQGLMTTQDEVRVTLVLDSDDPAIVDGTALAAGRLGGRVTATYGDQIELVVPVQTAMEYGKQANKQSFFADLADFAHVRDIRRTPLAQPMTAPLARSSVTRVAIVALHADHTIQQCTPLVASGKSTRVCSRSESSTASRISWQRIPSVKSGEGWVSARMASMKSIIGCCGVPSR